MGAQTTMEFDELLQRHAGALTGPRNEAHREQVWEEVRCLEADGVGLVGQSCGPDKDGWSDGRFESSPTRPLRCHGTSSALAASQPCPAAPPPVASRGAHGCSQRSNCGGTGPSAQIEWPVVVDLRLRARDLLADLAHVDAVDLDA